MTGSTAGSALERGLASKRPLSRSPTAGARLPVKDEGLRGRLNRWPAPAPCGHSSSAPCAARCWRLDFADRSLDRPATKIPSPIVRPVARAQRAKCPETENQS